MIAPAHPLGPLAPLAACDQWIVVKLVPLPNGKTDKLPVARPGRSARRPRRSSSSAAHVRCVDTP